MLDKLDIRRDEIKISQHNKITYLGCILDGNLSGESMASRVLNKIGGRLNFLYRKKSFLNLTQKIEMTLRNVHLYFLPKFLYGKKSFLNLKLRRMLCNALIQPHFDYACSAWYPNLNKNLTKKIQTAQNKCIRFCLGLENRDHIGVNEFKTINWLPVQNRYEQCVSVSVFKFCKNLGPA